MQTIQARLKELWKKIKDFFKKLNKKILILLGVCLVVIVALAIAAIVRMNQKEYAVLFTGLSSSETTTVVQFLNDNGVTDFRIQNDSILVPAGREGQLQAQLILSGQLNDAFLYPYYTENAGTFSTSEEQKRAWLISTQERLEAIIRRFDGVREAWVELAPGTEQVYVLEDASSPTTAAVTIETNGNRALSENVVQAIRYTVSHSVEKLNIEDVSIQDTYGNPYSDFGDTSTMTDQATVLKMQYEEQIRNSIRREVFQGLSSIYGKENVTVNVLCTVEVSRKFIDSTTYNQPAGSVEGGGLIYNDHLFYERIQGGETPAGGTVGTTTNSDLNGNFPNYPDWTEIDNGDSQYVGDQVDRDHAIDTTKTQEEVLEGRLTDLRVMVTINQNAKSSGSVPIEALRDSVASLAGIAGTGDALNRVSVIIAPFEGTEPSVPGGVGDGYWIFTSENSWIIYAAIGGLVLFVVLLVLILVLAGRRRKQKRLAEEQAMAEAMEAEAMAEAVALMTAETAVPVGGADIMEVNAEKSIELRQEVRRFAQNNPEIAAQMVKAWLKGDDTGA